MRTEMLALAAAWGLAAAVPAQEEVHIESDTYTSARVCGSCHTAIHAKWKNSMHALSLTDPIFQTSFAQTQIDYGKKESDRCLKCHAPTVLFTQDWNLEKEISREGVTCDFCHTISGMNLEDPENPYVITIGKVKRGPIKAADPTAHHAESSELHTTSGFCGPCHEYTSPAGARVLETWSEWKAGPYAEEGTQCQTCHMPTVPGSTIVRPEVKRSAIPVNLHDLQGGHSADQVRRAAKVEILGSSRTGDEVRVEVAVTNVGSGHRLPTGLPSRELVLVVAALDAQGRTLASQEVVFRKTVVDAEGRRLLRDADIMVRAARVVEDTRLKPRETRVVSVRLPAPGLAPRAVEAQLAYRYVPLVSVPHEMRIDLGKARRTL